MVQGIETVALLERRQGSVKVGDIVEVLWRTTLDLFERLHDNDDKSTYCITMLCRPDLRWLYGQVREIVGRNSVALGLVFGSTVVSVWQNDSCWCTITKDFESE